MCSSSSRMFLWRSLALSCTDWPILEDNHLGPPSSHLIRLSNSLRPWPLTVWGLVSILMAQAVKNLPVMQETWVRSLGREDLLEEEVATHSSIPAWRIPRTEQPGGLQSMGSQRVRNNWSGWTNGTWTWLLGRHFSFVHLSSECLLCTRHWVVIEDLIVNTAGEVSAHGVYHLAG